MKKNRETRGKLAAAIVASLLLGHGHASAQVPETGIRLGQRIDGAFDGNDPVEPYRNQRAQRFAFDGTAGEVVEIVMTSSEVDSFLFLEDPAGTLLLLDDDGGGNFNARLRVALPLDGRYTIVASTYSPEIGSYSLLLREYRAVPIGWRELPADRPVAGALEDTDASRLDGRFVDGFTFAGSAGDIVELALEANDEFDPYVILVGPTGETIAENDDAGTDTHASHLVATLPHPGDYRVLVTSYAPAVGDYVLTRRGVSRRPVALGAIDFATPVRSELGAGDGVWRARDTLAESYAFSGRAGQRVVIEMRSESIDSFVALLGPDGAIIAEDDDGAGGLDSRLVSRLERDGEYRIVATSYRLAEGTFELRLDEAPAQPLHVHTLTLDSMVPERLTTADARRANGDGVMDVYHLALGAGERVVVSARSTKVDLVLWVTAPSGEILAQDDDSAGGTDPLVEIEAPYAGTYLVGVASNRMGTGPYELFADSGDARAASPPEALVSGTPVAGALERGDDRRSVHVGYRDRYEFEGGAGESVEIRMSSASVDCYLYVYGPDGELLAENDDGGGGFDSRADLVLPSDGTYTVHATSYAPAIGRYRLTLDAFEAPVPRVAPIAMDQPVEGVLDRSDPRSSRYGTLTDTYAFAAEPGDWYVVSLSSAVLDTYLVVVDPNGEVIAEDDDSGDGFDAEVAFAATMPGEYLLLASTVRFAEGDYQLSVTAQADASRERGAWSAEP